MHDTLRLIQLESESHCGAQLRASCSPFPYAQIAFIFQAEPCRDGGPGGIRSPLDMLLVRIDIPDGHIGLLFTVTVQEQMRERNSHSLPCRLRDEDTA